MLGYLCGILAALVLAALCFAGFSSAGGARPGRAAGGGKPVQPENPSADAPTPDRSATASKRQVTASRELTPPA